jgi:hypothetical protein
MEQSTAYRVAVLNLYRVLVSVGAPNSVDEHFLILVTRKENLSAFGSNLFPNLMQLFYCCANLIGDERGKLFAISAGTEELVIWYGGSTVANLYPQDMSYKA